MALESLKIENFRCLESVEFAPGSSYSLVYGENASGKTSLLEAIAYLGRGKSFRGATTQALVRHDQQAFTLFGRVSTESHTASVGVQNSRDGLQVRINGEDGNAAGLAEVLPLQVIGPDIHSLVAGSPEERRKHLDWIAFHVEHGYLDIWRRFRRALKQRNAAVRGGTSGAALAGWDQELVETGMAVDAARRGVATLVNDLIQEMGGDLLGYPVQVEYRQGWAQEHGLAEALAANADRDRETGSTQAGPHRGDLRLIVDDRQARKLVSRGQQKLLACSLVLTAAELVQTHLERPLLMLLDDPAAELDERSLERLMQAVLGLGSQVIATSLQADAHFFPEEPRLFHVEHGNLSQVS